MATVTYFTLLLLFSPAVEDDFLLQRWSRCAAQIMAHSLRPDRHSPLLSSKLVPVDW